MPSGGQSSFSRTRVLERTVGCLEFGVWGSSSSGRGVGVFGSSLQDAAHGLKLDGDVTIVNTERGGGDTFVAMGMIRGHTFIQIKASQTKPPPLPASMCFTVVSMSSLTVLVTRNIFDCRHRPRTPSSLLTTLIMLVVLARLLSLANSRSPIILGHPRRPRLLPSSRVTLDGLDQTACWSRSQSLSKKDL